MAASQQQIGGLLRWSPFLSNNNNNNKIAFASAAVKNKKKKNTGKLMVIKAAVAVSNSETRDRIKLKQLFQKASQRCHTSPYQGLSFTLDDFLAAIDSPSPTKVKGNVEDQSRLVDSNRQPRLQIGSLVTGTVQTLKPYGAFIHIGGGISGLLHVSQISHHRVSDVATLLQPGDTLKVMILSHDPETGRLSLSTKKLEPTPGDMIRNPKLVFDKAEEMAQTFKQRIAQAEAMARADMLRFQPESWLTLNSDGPLTSVAGLDYNEIPSAEEKL